MCGRFVIDVRAGEMREHFGVADAPEMFPRFNIGPEQRIAVIRIENSQWHLAMLRWGFPVRLPGTAQPKQVINARGETVDTKFTFRDAFSHRRCLIPASGFYEWLAAGRGPKQPYFVRPRSGVPFAMAGIWEREIVPDGQAIESAVIVTCEANALLKLIHARMPVIVMAPDWNVWLAGPPDAAKALIRPAPEDFFEAYPVGTAVNRMANDGPGLVQPVQNEPGRTDRQKDLF
jgi:putative SOS response-associated peptidase YedK